MLFNCLKILLLISINLGGLICLPEGLLMFNYLADQHFAEGLLTGDSLYELFFF